MPRKKKMMTRKEVEDKYIDKERGPTMIYPESSMVNAHRIFGPGHNDLGDLQSTRDRLFKRGLPEPGESPLTTGKQLLDTVLTPLSMKIHPSATCTSKAFCLAVDFGTSHGRIVPWSSSFE